MRAGMPRGGTTGRVGMGSWLPECVSTYGPEIDRLFYVIYYVTGAVFFAVQLTLLAFVILYRHRDGRRATYTHGNTALEIAWTIAPAILLVILAFVSRSVWADIKEHVPPSDRPPSRAPQEPGRTMVEAISHPEARHVGAGHDEVGFIRHYIFSTDHKMIGKQFLTLGLFGLVMGGILALLVRWELAFPETPVPGMGWVPEPTMYGGIIPPETYNAFFTMHATIMIFFAVMPILVGCFGNFL